MSGQVACAPAASQDQYERPGRLCAGEDPLGQSDLPASGYQLGAEPEEQASQHA
jgi:hypothetical protein